MSKRFTNSPSSVVTDSFQGLSSHSDRFTVVDPASGHHVAIRSSLINKTQPRCVSVVSGGGCGHEPMAAGYIGKGMLAGAVSGDLFAAPSDSAVSTLFNHIQSHSTGILIIVMNYQGDRLSFGKAVRDFTERNPDYPIRTVLVKDDIALPPSANTRGIAGTVFVIKVAGAAADQGRPLEEVGRIAERAAASIASFGVALDPCTMPGHAIDSERLGADQIELGMGIHNEVGAERRDILDFGRDTFASELIAEICRRIDSALLQRKDSLPPCNSLAVMVNNLGAVPQSEMLILTKCVDDFIQQGGGSVLNAAKRVHIFCGTYMTSFQMNGVSISCFMIPDDDGLTAQLLRAPVDTPAWNPGYVLRPVAERRILVVHGSGSSSTAHDINNTQQHTGLDSPGHGQWQSTTLNPSALSFAGGPIISAEVPHSATRGATRSGLPDMTENCIMSITTALKEHENELSALDAKTGDGDMGNTVARGCDKIQADLQVGAYATAAGNAELLFKQISVSCSTMGGTIGSLTQTFLDSVASSFREQRQNSQEPSWRQAVVDGTQAVMDIGGASVGHRTLVDALKPAADVLANPGRPLAEAAAAARSGCESTKSMTEARFGRSSLVSAAALLNNADPGAHAVVIIFDALVQAMSA